MEHTTAATAASETELQKEARQNYRIEKNVPMPVCGVQGSLPNTLRKMAFGDSFEFPEPQVMTVRTAITKVQRGSASRFTCRKQVNGNYRVWCIKSEAA